MLPHMDGLSKPAELLQSCTFWCMALLPHEGRLHPAGHHTGCWAEMGRLKVLHPRERNDHQGRSTQADDGGGFHQTRPDFPNSVPSPPCRGKSLKKFQNLKRNGHFFHTHVMKRAVMASKDGSKSMLGKPGGTYPVSSSILAQALEVSLSLRVPATEGTTSLMALLETYEVKWFFSKLGLPSPRSRRASQLLPANQSSLLAPAVVESNGNT